MNNTEEKNIMDDNMTFNFISFYEDEWQYRYSQFQFLFIKISIVVYVLILFSYLPDVIGIDITKYHLPILIFPILGMILAILELTLLLSQNARLLILSKKIKELTKLISEAYMKDDYTILQKKQNKETTKTKFYKIHLGNYVSCVNFAVQFITAVLVIIALVLIVP